MRTFLLVPGVRTYPAQDDALANEIFQNNNSWVVIDHNGTTHIGFPALIYVLKSSPLFWPVAMFLCIPPIPWAGERLYPFNAITSYGIFSADRFPQIQAAEGGTSRVDTGSGSSVLGVHHLLEHSPILHVNVPRQISWVGPVFRVYQNWGCLPHTPYSRMDGT